MKTLRESLEHLLSNEKGIIVFDIDDTLIKTDPNIIKVGKYVNGDKSNKIWISSEEYAKDPDVPKHSEWFDFSEFRNPNKVVQSILHSDPIIKNLKILDKYINAGYEFCFLTARGCEDAITYALNRFLKYRDVDGILKDISPKFNKKLSAAVNDINRRYDGKNDPEKKSNVLKKLSRMFDRVVFVDDDKKNVDFARGLQLKNLKVIHV
jgi:FMN phosphatase YigB (HAD superfamily)